MRCERVVIRNKLGLHARASAKFVSLAAGFDAEITLRRDHQIVNGKSIMGILMLAAAQGTELEICAEGKDEARAVAALAALVADRFGEEE